jgi:hypothetical protein
MVWGGLCESKDIDCLVASNKHKDGIAFSSFLRLEMAMLPSFEIIELVLSYFCGAIHR